MSIRRIVYKKSTVEFLLCVNASNIKKDFDHFLDQSVDYDCKIENLSHEYGQLALQGPTSEKVLSRVLKKDLSSLKKMFFIEENFRFGEAIISRTGYTGEDGFEIYCSLDDIDKWALAFNDYKDSGDLKWAGLAARDSLRLEAGLPLYGHELSTDISPVQAGFSWAIDWRKDNFLGRSSLFKEQKSGGPGRVYFYEVLDRRIPRSGCEIFFKGKKMGRVLSGGFSPTLGKPIGSAWISLEGIENLRSSGWKAKLRASDLEIKFEEAVLKKK